MTEFIKDNLVVKIFDNRHLMGLAAAVSVAEKINELLKTKTFVNMIFAAAPSQNDFLRPFLEPTVMKDA